MRRTDRLLPRVLFLVLLTAGLLLFFNGQVHSAEASGSEEAEANVDKMMAGLSDEQVRELLLDDGLLLFDHDELFVAAREGERAFGLERPGHRLQRQDRGQQWRPISQR